MEKEKRTNAHGRKAEKRLAKVVDKASYPSARLTPGSGAFREKGDISMIRTLVEVKSTVRASLSVKKQWLDKITLEALAQGKMPALAINFVQGNGEPVEGGAWVAIPLWAFNEKF